MTPVPVDVRVRIVDQDGNVLTGAAVRLAVSAEADGIVQFVNENGETEFKNVGTQKVWLAAQAYGYYLARTSVEVSPGMNEIHIPLEPDTSKDLQASTCQPKNVYSSARYMKLVLYETLEYQPDIIILGSSRAYTMSPAYIEELTGAKGFNMSIQGGSFLDTFVYARYIIEHQKESLPRLLLVEFQLQTINQEYLVDDTPLALWQYIPDNKYFKPDLIFCDTTFDPLLNENFRDDLVWIFEPDGTAYHRPLTARQYNLALNRQIDNLKTGAMCEALAPTSLEYIEKLVALAEENNISLVFYRPPFNKLLSDTFKDDPDYATCGELTNAYMQTLDEQHENVFYMDLSGQEQISGNADGYYDGTHFKPDSSRALVDLLLPAIQAGLEWAAGK
jgi:hypothetical protein